MADRILFTVNEYDRDGDITDKGIFLHNGGGRIKVAKDIKRFDEFIESLKDMSEEIKANYSEAE
jgi:hypothetical protein